MPRHADCGCQCEVTTVAHPTLPTRKIMSVCHWLASREAMFSSKVDGVTKMSGGVGFGGQNGACNKDIVCSIQYRTEFESDWNKDERVI